MHYRDVLKNCAAILNDRDKKYGDSDICFNRIANIASIVLDRPISTYDVAIILACVKLGRIPGDPAYADNYVDLANYAAFSAHFADKNAEVSSAFRAEEPVKRETGAHNVTRAFPSIPGRIRNQGPSISESAFAAVLNSVEEDIVRQSNE